MFKAFLSLLFMSTFIHADTIEQLQLDIISYDKLIQGDADALKILDKALHAKGIVGVRNIPDYKEQYEQFIKATREFNSLPEEIKEHYKPNRDLGETFLGYEVGKDKFQQSDVTWVVDDLKTSYYAFIPDSSQNKWPTEVNLKDSFKALGQLMVDTGEIIISKIGLVGQSTGLELEENFGIGRLLYYRKSTNNDNPYWCGAHFDHGLFTVILPAVYFVDGEQVSEALEAGLFVRTSKKAPFRKVCAEDLDVMMFQVGEFGQLVINDAIRATEHRVHKAHGAVERYTLAVFFSAPMDTHIYSKSLLTSDARYGAPSGESCTFRHWHEASFERYLAKK